MLLGDEDVGDGTLAGDVLQRVLDRRPIVHLVQLQRVVLGPRPVQQLLRRPAVRAVRLGEDGFCRKCVSWVGVLV